MRAQVINEYGAPDVLRLVEQPAPTAGPGEVRVRVAYAALNPVEWKIRSGALAAMLPLTFPYVLGNEMSGVVDQLGDQVTGLSVGDRVTGSCPAAPTPISS